MSDEMVTIGTFQFPWQADLWREKLESEGIKAFVADATASLAVGPPVTLDGVRLQVAAEDAEQAAAIMEEPEGDDV